MWASIISRSHDPIKVFPYGPNSDEVMLYGTVEYELKEGGKKASKDWAARAKLRNVEGEWKFAEYQVYLVNFCFLSLWSCF